VKTGILKLKDIKEWVMIKRLMAMIIIARFFAAEVSTKYFPAADQ
jgi:hypothetical protein